MAKAPNLTTITTGYYSTETLNSNFEDIEDSFENTLSLDGSTPNAMGADLDMNGNDILNAGAIYATSVTVGGVPYTGGGSSLDNPKNFSSEQALVDAINAGDIEDGQLCSVLSRDFYLRDTAVAFGDSILRDYGVSGVRHPGKAKNEYFGCFFHSRDVGATAFSASATGTEFSALTHAPLPAVGTGNDVLGGRDPSVVPYRGKWYTLYTGSDESTHDFRMGVSDDLLTWNEYYMSLGATIKTSSTTALSGGSVPAINIWGPEVVFNPTDSQLYVVLSVVYDNQLTDDYGNTIHNRRAFYSTFDPETRTVGEPVSMDMGGAEATVSFIGHAFFTDSNDVLWVAIKNDVTKKMEIWESDGGLAGTFTKRWTSTSELSQEGYSWVKKFYYDENGDKQFKLRIYIDQNRMGPDQAYPDEFAEIPWFIEADAPGGTWSDPERCYFETPVRHGTVVNMGHNVSPKHMRDVERLRALYGRNPRENLSQSYELNNGTEAIRPRNDYVYYVDGTAHECGVTIMDGSADRFFLAAYGGDSDTGINVVYEVDGSDVVSNTPNATYKVGYGEEVLVEFRRTADGTYFPVSPASVVTATETVQGKMAVATVSDIRAGGTGPNNEAIVPAKMRDVPRFDPSTEGTVADTDKVWMLDVSTEEMRWLNMEDIPSGTSLTNWGESGTVFLPNSDGYALGNDTYRVREVSLQPIAADGTAGSNTDTSLFIAQSGGLRVRGAGVTSDNEGADVGFHHRAHDPSVTTGTHVWDRSDGQGLNFATTLTGTLTVDVSAMKTGEELRVRVGNPASNTINFTLPSGSLEWIGGQVTPSTNAIYYTLWRVGNSNVAIVANEAS